MSRLNQALISTEHGLPSAFSPDENWSGDQKQYRVLLHERYDSSPMHFQEIYVAARIALLQNNPEFTGPYAMSALSVIESLKISITQSM